MDENNLAYLQKTLDYLGFGTRLNEVLASSIYRRPEKFSLGINQRYIPWEFRSDPGQGVDHMHFELNFSKAKDADVYFLNSYRAELRRYNSADAVVQNFELERDNRMSALQSYKLLCGLSLQKEIFIKNNAQGGNEQRSKVPVWFKLDLSVSDDSGNHPMNRFFPGYGYDLDRAVDKYAFSGLEDPEKKEAVIKALRYGNLVELPLKIGEKEEPVYLAANPKAKTLDLYSRDMKAIRDEHILGTGQSKVENPPPEKKRSFEGVLPPPRVAKQFPWQHQGGDKGNRTGR
ncbi:hypothetical protein [Pedobacter miscanthi]|uniref:hypothetical protein n=1 Tax=Pedobacter miscanthi TaxID=2259170 RepID=UPI00292D9F33|nr:hypothetical protein [Pedobacter miscanthi]